jgi:Tol biopolymer transport system component/predicted Ser/Thr protein kinase
MAVSGHVEEDLSMTPAEHQDAKELFGRVVELEPHLRAPILDQACAGRPQLRCEVESLLVAYQNAGAFLDAPVADRELYAEGIRTAEVMIGQTLGLYRIEAMLGQGGMGVVYRALDTKLSRPVAVKFLFDDLADPAARRRFQREAQVASSLNHPHILTVYDVGDFEGRQYLVTEFVDGGTLKDWARAERRAWHEILELLLGVADGLATAHAAGILHRDIKPDNILIGRNGYAKLADFGLAKPTPSSTPEAVTRIPKSEDTRPGLIIGTIAYMSPEQASGGPVDARSDIFSFGVVLYELLAARRPFAGATDLELLQTIIHAAPQPLDADVPAPLRLVLEKALEKDPAERYQSMRDVIIDLRNLMRQSAETLAQRPARRIRWASAAVLTAAALAAGGALIVWRLARPAVPGHLEYTQLTNFADSATSPALSPDGRILAFIRSVYTFVGPGQVYVKLLPDGEPVQLTHDDLNKSGSPKFSPDGTRLAYTALTKSGWETWVVPVLGGQPRPFLANASGLTWIGAGARQSRLLYSEPTGRGDQMAIVSSTEGRAQHRTVYMPPEKGMAHRSYLSPDRKQVLLAEMDSAWLPCRLTPFDGSSPGKPVGPAPAHCTDAAWSPDGKWMYFSADAGNGYHIWRQRFPEGAPEQVTSGVTEEEGIELAPDGRSFVTSIGASQSTVWFHDSRGDRQITSEGYGLLPFVSPDGKKLYYLLRAKGARHFVSGELWMVDLESGQRQRLLPDFLMQHYAISADSQRVVFVVSGDTGRSPVWVAALDGRSAPRQASTADAWNAYFVAGGYVVFMGEEMGTKVVYRIKENGSELQKVVRTDSAGSLFSASPDGKWVAIPVSTDSMAWPSMVYPVGGGSPTLLCVPCETGNGVERVRSPGVSWSPDGRFLYLRFRESVYAIPLAPGQMLPPIPPSGFRSKEDVAALPGARLIPEPGAFPGPNPSIYAFTKVSTHRNIYRVSLP